MLVVVDKKKKKKISSGRIFILKFKCSHFTNE